VRAALRLLVQQAGGDETKAPRSSMRGRNARQV
jgi:hypothetical protein